MPGLFPCSAPLGLQSQGGGRGCGESGSGHSDFCCQHGEGSGQVLAHAYPGPTDLPEALGC